MEGTHTLSRVVDYTYDEVHPSCMGIYENPAGGRVCVAGYYPWEQLQTLAKSSQMKAVLRWLSRDGLPAYVASYHRVNLWVRSTTAGNLAITLLNGSLDAARDVEILALTGGDTMRVTDMRGGEVVVESTGNDGPYRRFIIPEIASWEVALAVI